MFSSVPIDIPLGPHTVLGAISGSHVEIGGEHRRHMLAVRDTDGSVHPGQSPEYIEAMAQSIEVSAGRIIEGLQQRTPPSFADAWSLAGTAMSSFFLGRRGISSSARTSRSFGELSRFAARLNELAPASAMTVHAGHGWTRASLIAPRITALADELLQPACREPGSSVWRRQGYTLSATDGSYFSEAPHEFELRIGVPDTAGHDLSTDTVWLLESDTGAMPGALRLSPMLCHHHEFDEPRYRLAVEAHINRLLGELVAARALPERLMFAYEAYWWMLRQNKEAVGDKALHVLTSVLLAVGHSLPPAPAGVDPALEALSRTLPDWLVAAYGIWGRGIGPRAVLQREVSGHLPPPRRLAALPAPLPLLDEVLCLSSSPRARARRAQIEAAMEERVQANLRIA